MMLRELHQKQLSHCATSCHLMLVIASILVLISVFLLGSFLETIFLVLRLVSRLKSVVLVSVLDFKSFDIIQYDTKLCLCSKTCRQLPV